MNVFHSPTSNFTVNRMNAANTSNGLLSPWQNHIHCLGNSWEDPNTVWRKRGAQMKILKRRKQFKWYDSFLHLLWKTPTFPFPKIRVIKLPNWKTIPRPRFANSGVGESVIYHTDTENKACQIQFTVADHSSLLLSQAWYWN